MAQPLSSAVTTCYRGDAGGTLPVREASSSVADDECITASASTSSSAEFCQYATAGMSEEQTRAAIETSRVQGWSELKYSAHDGAAPSCHAQQNRVIWEELKQRDPRVFYDWAGDRLKLGRLIAEGGQAHIYEASLDDHDKYVAKVFKMEGFSLADLQRQWPLTTKKPSKSYDGFIGHDFVAGGVVFGEHLDYCSMIHCGTFLEDGRFVFLMFRAWGDLRTLINLKLKDNNSQGPPFSRDQVLYIIYCISTGVGYLHDRGVLHRDLKAANVLVRNAPKGDDLFPVDVADFESGMLVEGTGFWRAPEVLRELQKKPCDRDISIWTEKVDVYSFAMTCYEILTGHIPFDGYVKSDWKRVIDGERPHLPDYIDPRVRKLVERCWYKEPSKRPNFKIISIELQDM